MSKTPLMSTPSSVPSPPKKSWADLVEEENDDSGLMWSDDEDEVQVTTEPTIAEILAMTPVTEEPESSGPRELRRMFITDVGISILRPADPYFESLIEMYSLGARLEGKVPADQLYEQFIATVRQFRTLTELKQFRSRLVSEVAAAIRNGRGFDRYVHDPPNNVPELPNSQLYANENHINRSYLRLKLTTDLSIVTETPLSTVITTVPVGFEGDRSWFTTSRSLIRDIKKELDLKILPIWVRSFLLDQLRSLGGSVDSVISYTDGELILPVDFPVTEAQLSDLDPRIGISKITLRKIEFERKIPEPKNGQSIIGFYDVLTVPFENGRFTNEYRSIIGNTTILNQVYRQVLLREAPTLADRVGVTNELFYTVTEYRVKG